MHNEGSTKRTDKALKILMQIVKNNKKNEDKEISYEKVNDDSEEEEDTPELEKEKQEAMANPTVVNFGIKSNLPSVDTTAKTTNNAFSRKQTIIERQQTDSTKLPEMTFKRLATRVKDDISKPVALSIGVKEDA